MYNAAATSLEQRMQSDTPISGAGAAIADSSIPSSPSPPPTDQASETVVAPDVPTSTRTALTQDVSLETNSDAGPCPLLDLPQELFDSITTHLLYTDDFRKLRDVSVRCAKKMRKVFAEAHSGGQRTILLCDRRSLEKAAEASSDPDFGPMWFSTNGLILDLAELPDFDAEKALQEERVPGRDGTYCSLRRDGEEEDLGDEIFDDSYDGYEYARAIRRENNEKISELWEALPHLNELKRQQKDMRESNLDLHLLTTVFLNLREFGKLKEIEIACHPSFHKRYKKFGEFGLEPPHPQDIRTLRIIFEALCLSDSSPRIVTLSCLPWVSPPESICQDETLMNRMSKVFNEVESVHLDLSAIHSQKYDIRPFMQTMTRSESLQTMSIHGGGGCCGCYFDDDESHEQDDLMIDLDAFMAELLTSTVPKLKRLSLRGYTALNRANLEKFVARHSTSLKTIGLEISCMIVDAQSVQVNMRDGDRMSAGMGEEDARKILGIPDHIELCESCSSIHYRK